MSPPRIVFGHGLEGSPEGAKIQAMRAAGLDVVAPDGRGQQLAARVALLEEATRGGGVVLGGSSYGGLAAAYFATAYPERLTGLVLAAPALHWAEPPVADPALLCAPPGLPTIVIHGLGDDVVPIAVSRHYQQLSGPHVELIERDDDHRLGGSLDVLVDAISRLCR